jgi:hypothetical protein
LRCSVRLYVARRKPSDVPRGIPRRAGKSKLGKAHRAPLTPWNCHPWKRPRPA